MINSLPSVSIHCITYGRPFLLEEAIESFLRQTYSGTKEMVILNDLSEQELIFDHPEIRIINEPRRYPTLGDARNALIEKQTGDIIIQLDDDDIILPQYISTCVKLLGDKDWMMPKNGFTLYKSNFKLVDGPGAHISFRRSAWRKIGGYSSMNSGEDWDFIHKLENGRNAGIAGGFVDIDLKNVEYIYTWGGDTYHRAILSLSDNSPNKKDSNKIVRDLILKDIELNRLPKGKIQLIPNWKHDYIGIVNEFLKDRK